MKPLHPSYQFSTNGIIFLIGKPGSGKTYWLWKHMLLITERLFKRPYYNKIIFCSTSGKADKTSDVMSKEVKSPIVYASEAELMDYLKKAFEEKD